MFFDEVCDLKREAGGTLPGRHPIIAYLEGAAVFQIDEVAAFIRAVKFDQGRVFDRKDHWDPYQYMVAEIPNVAPLAPVCWLEWQGSALDFGQSRWTRFGVLVCYFSPDDPLVAGIPATIQLTADAQIGWIMTLLPFVGHRDGAITWEAFSFALAVADDGRILGRERHEFAYFPDPGRPVAEVPSKELFGALPRIYPALLGVCFGHCRNVVVREHQQPRQQRRARERAGHPPLVNYRTLAIGPAVHVLEREGDVHKVGIGRSLHLCRGHFAHYPAGHYFGRNPEPVTIYRPMHLRGNPQLGAALKDYRITRPGPDQEAQ